MPGRPLSGTALPRPDGARLPPPAGLVPSASLDRKQSASNPPCLSKSPDRLRLDGDPSTPDASSSILFPREHEASNPGWTDRRRRRSPPRRHATRRLLLCRTSPHTVGRSGSRRLHGECFRTCGQALCLPCDGILAYPPENHKSNDTAAKPQGSSRHRESEQGAVQSTGPCSLPAGLGFGKEECRSVPQAGSSSSGSSSADDVLCQAGLRSLLFSFLVPCSSSSSRYWTGPLPTFFSTGGIAPPLLCRQNNGLDSELAHPAVAEVERGMEDLAGLELEASHLRLDGVEGQALFNGDSELFDAFLAEDDSGS